MLSRNVINYTLEKSNENIIYELGNDKICSYLDFIVIDSYSEKLFELLLQNQNSYGTVVN